MIPTIILSAACAVVFATLYSAAQIRMKVLASRNKQQALIILKLRTTILDQSREVERVKKLDAEVVRLGKIRQRTDAGFKLKNAQLDAAEAEVARLRQRLAR